MELWEQFKHVAPGMLKRINGGNLNGKTDINPVWRFQALTEKFGPVGIGWTIKEIERWTNECAGEVGAFVKVHLRYIMTDDILGDRWSEPVEGIGGSKLCGKGKGDGLNDEAWKMAYTDAVSVACKALGMAADVYTGQQSHQDADQQASGDYGTKYEPRQRGQNSPENRPASSYTPRPSNGQNRPISAPPTQQPAAKFCVTFDMVNAGKAWKLITALSKHDYDDLPDWQAGLAELREKYDFATGVMEKIEQLAVAERNARQQAAIDGAAKQPSTNTPS